VEARPAPAPEIPGAGNPPLTEQARAASPLPKGAMSDCSYPASTHVNDPAALICRSIA